MRRFTNILSKISQSLDNHLFRGTVSNPSISGAVLSGTDATLVLDFGKEVAGYVTVTFGAGTQPIDGASPTLGVAFSESEQFLGRVSDQSQEFGIIDGHLSYPAQAGVASSHTAETKFLRGGFRYLTLFAATDSTIEVTNVTVAYTGAPAVPEAELRDYNGYCKWNLTL